MAIRRADAEQALVVHAEKVIDSIAYFPLGHGERWIRTGTGHLEESIAQQLGNTLIAYLDARPTKSSDLHYQLLERLCRDLTKVDDAAAYALTAQFQELRLTVREAKWIRCVLNQDGLRDDWADIALAALSRQDVLLLANEQPRFAEWIGNVSSSRFPPNFLDVVPPLCLHLLREVRREVDRLAKRFVRERSRRSTGCPEDFSHLTVTLSDTLTDRETLEKLQTSLHSMEPKLQAALYMRLMEGATLRQVQEQLNLNSLTSAHRLVRSAVAELRKSFLSGSDLD